MQQLSCSAVLLNCPTHRRTVKIVWELFLHWHLNLDQVERRTKRKFGCKEWGTWRIPVVNKRIRVDHEVPTRKFKCWHFWQRYVQYFELASSPITFQAVQAWSIRFHESYICTSSTWRVNLRPVSTTSWESWRQGNIRKWWLRPGSYRFQKLKYIWPAFTLALKLGMMDGFGTGEKDKEVCVVYQDDDQKVQMSLQRICWNNMC